MIDDRIALVVGRIVLQEGLKFDDLVNQLRLLQKENEAMKALLKAQQAADEDAAKDQRYE